ncbi:hypothetical protein [Poseidonibacter lekithochrous]|uniref:hypothetical protein n=1 Tax=Poseidonibacter lekithochrous TaxID=1904463 RepID=UPI000D38417F|nr:hypothetical protein [Poseidonibacter lekithochrous]
MLRLYKKTNINKIFKLHKILKHIVFDIWCKADTNPWKSKTSNKKLKKLLHYSIKGESFEDKIEKIYNIFKLLSDDEKAKIKRAWKRNNDIEKLCNNDFEPIPLDDLNHVVKKHIKPFFNWCYTYILDQKETSGNKLEYYKELILINKFESCPCCGITDFELEDSDYREAFDHYLPKSEYPFASVNFSNLVPLCYKCNSDRKSTKNPIQNNNKAFYPFSNSDDHEIIIEIIIDPNKDLDKLETKDIKIILKHKEGKNIEIKTWNRLFDIEKRYNSKIKKYSRQMLKKIKRRHRSNKQIRKNIKYKKTITIMIEEYKDDFDKEKNFLKVPLLKDIKKRSDIFI